MIRRLKQNIKEKTGQAEKTALPADIETEMQRTQDSRVLMEKTKRASEALIAKWKSNGLTPTEQIADDVRHICTKSGIDHYTNAYKAISDMHKDLGQIERRTHDEIHKSFVEDICQQYLKIENAQAMDACSLLRKRRLDRDAYASEYNSKATDERKTLLDKAQVELDAAVAVARGHFAKAPIQNERQIIALHTLIDQLQHHYVECLKVTQATLKTIKNLEDNRNNNKK